MKKGKKKLLSQACAVGFAMLMAGTAYAGPQVNVMPDGEGLNNAYTWIGNNLKIWGNVKGGVAPYTYTWNVDNNGAAECYGAVTNTKDISCTYAYPSSTSGYAEAVLTVTDANGDTGTGTVRIKVLSSATPEAQANLAIERGLKWLYDRQNALGNGFIYNLNSYNSYGAETAAAVSAFENKNHKPCTTDQNGDGVINAADRAIWENGRIYANTVHQGLDALISTLVPVNIAASYDNHNANSKAVADSYDDRRPYKIGMYMMALVGAGGRTSGAPELVATTGPAGVAGKTYRELVGDMVDYCDYAQYHDATYGGGWIYGPGQGYGDNSASQWPAIGMDAAETVWQVPVRQAIKDLNAAWINYSQYFTGYDPNAWYYGALGYRGKDVGIARSASGIAQMNMQGKVKTDARILAASKYLSIRAPGYNDVGWDGYYDLYAVAKAARTAKIDTNSDGIGDTYSEIQLFNGWDWYPQYAARLVSEQRADGSWHTWNISYTFGTAWAVEILTKNVVNLRPVAELTATPNPTPPRNASGTVGQVVFNACASTHQDPAKSLVSWTLDVNNDGAVDFTGNFPTCTATYGGYPDTGANYTATAKLQVTDQDGASAEKLITVSIKTDNVAPVVNPGGPYHGAVGQAITFDGSGSYDPNAGQGIVGDHIVSWNWDLNGDGLFDDATGQTVTKTWASPYSGQIGLKVCDDAGACTASTASSNITEVYVVNIWPVKYTLVASSRISRTVYSYTYKFTMGNQGNSTAGNATAVLDKWPAQVTVVDGNVAFGDIAGGANVTPAADTFTLRIDRSIPVASTDLTWKVQYNDVANGGALVTTVNMPLQ